MYRARRMGGDERERRWCGGVRRGGPRCQERPAFGFGVRKLYCSIAAEYPHRDRDMEDSEHRRPLGSGGGRERRKSGESGLDEPAVVPELTHPVAVGYSGSAPSQHALAYATGMAKLLVRPLLIVSVVRSPIYCEPFTGEYVGPTSSHEDPERWLLAEFGRVCGQGSPAVKAVICVGKPSRQLAAAAAESRADVLIVGAPACRWHRVAWSVPAWLVRHACCPVVVVP